MVDASQLAATRLVEAFGARRVLIPVVHASGADQAITSTQIAAKAGCEAVFLIGHGMSYRNLLYVFDEVVLTQTCTWVGLNFLDLSPIEAASHMPVEANGCWVDDGMIDETSSSQTEADRLIRALSSRDRPPLLFAGVAFKGQRQPVDLESTCKLAKRFDVVTTSGLGTGIAADPAKIRRMRAALGDHPLALASGVTADNVADYPGVNCFLVGTSLEDDFGMLIYEEVARLRELIEK